MKFNTREAAAFFDKPHRQKPAVLIYGADPTRVALRRAEVLGAWLGKNAKEEMRLAEVQAAQLRQSPSLIHDEIKAVGFFPGPRAVWLEGGNDGVLDSLKGAIQAWAEGDAQILVTAGSLPPASKLRKFFEKSPSALTIAIYNDPPSVSEITAQMKKAGLPQPAPEVMRDLLALAAAVDPGDFHQFIQKLALYKYSDQSPLTAQDIAECAPFANESDLDELVFAIADGQIEKVAAQLSLLRLQGVGPVRMCMVLERHFLNLEKLQSDPDGLQNAAQKLRPPVFGPKRNRLLRQCAFWQGARLDQAFSRIMDVSLLLRSANSNGMEMPTLERLLLRLAALSNR